MSIRLYKSVAELMIDFAKKEGVPLYVMIREALRKEITMGGLNRGQKIPSEDELATTFGVSRMTVRQGISDLIDEGLLYRRHGLGTFVAYPHIERDHTRLTNFFEAAEMKGINARAEVLKVEVAPAKQKVANALDINEGDLVIRVDTLRFADNEPVTYHNAYIPHALFYSLLSEDMEKQHLWKLFEKCGYRVKRAVQKLEAREADEQLAKLLGSEEGAPILFKERTVYADDGTPVEFTYCYNRGDMYSLTVVLER
jgi:GntR family transcriptional regulator